MALLLFCAFVATDASASEVIISSVAAEGAVTTDPQDPVWKTAPAAVVPLMPQNLLVPRGGGVTPSVEVQSVHTQDKIFIRLRWKDKSRNAEASGTEVFRDACAVELSVRPGMWPSPFHGDSEAPVNLWHWKADWQEDIDQGFLVVEKKHPAIAVDERRFPGERVFQTGEGAGNILSQRERKSPVENALSAGWRTVSTAPGQGVEGKGIFKEGTWTVVMSRNLRVDQPESGPNFAEGTEVPVAFAVWDGGSEERNGFKAVSIWQALRVEPYQAKESLPSKVERGERVFARFGCATCHGPDGRGGVKNPNAETGGEVPNLLTVANGFTLDEIKEKIRKGSDPASFDAAGGPPPLRMNAWSGIMDEQELDDLAAYLFSLLPSSN